ncbi:GTP binding protein (Bud4) [Pochonia chlamydosporia 170]|uniref:GTP binding protein (Bud4) n=1 Tax=Pochonia chlamydosporia 170 TaxID=1380566 RepID=A0A219AR60_METCM|nr:GTP binding protein (Bud4) [Pochonia chlamydosporia 170]OWT43267.1 GTP binding protein (Bud4) [Pochonia chlamydosporia 170]
MASEPVHPLRISKNTPTSSPKKMASALPRPLSEISPAEKRRNSPSWHPYSPKKAALPGNDSSPFQSSPLDSSTSPRLFWQNRNSENMLHGGRSGSPSPNRRSSIERLQRASRVKNSNILALEQKQEYDPTRIPHIERPLAKVQGSSIFTSSSSSSGFRSPDSGHQDSDNRSSFSMMSPSKVSPTLPEIPQKSAGTSSKDQASPTKSSLSPTKFNKNTFDPEAGTWSGHSSLSENEFSDGRYLNRHPKSVTFDAAPPQINEYEMATPDLSSVGTNSREGSYDSVEDEDEDLYDPAHIEVDESFDESLEDTDKTPVVGPDDWRGDSPMIHQALGADKFEGSPMPETAPMMANTGRTTPTNKRSDSANSNGDHRPLPPLPGMGHSRSQSSGSNGTSPGLSATAERMLGGSHRSLPVPPPAFASKSDIQNFGSHKMTLEERLKLMMLSDDTDAKSAAEQQRERRLRRGAGRERGGTPHSEADSDGALEALEADDTIGDISGLDFQMPPKISRESIMRRVNGNSATECGSEYRFSSPAVSPQRSPMRQAEASVMDLDPDVPIPSTEDSLVESDYEQEDSVIITRNSEDGEGHVLDYYEEETLAFDEDEEEEVHPPEEVQLQEPRVETEEPETIEPAEVVSVTAEQVSTTQHLQLEPFTGGLGIDGIDDPFISSKDIEEPIKNEPKAQEEIQITEQEVLEPPRRPTTPTRRMSKPEYDGTGWGEPDDEYEDVPDSPGSVIHHPAPEEERVSPPAIPERVATIKAPGAKLKTRLSNTPSDLAAMREARRQVSREVPDVPPIPEKHRNRMSRDLGTEQILEQDDFVARHPSFKNRSLTLDLDMGLSLDQDFERVIEAQKRGYLMRQNTKVITASDKDGDEHWKARSAHSSPTKHSRADSWTVEPWNGETRPRSPRKRATGTNGAVPPLPGQESNATAINHGLEEDVQSEVATIDSGERGRLFVKVMGVKDLDLPLPKTERTWFSLTLDNGVHCVTTAWLELARNAPIGQEFELVVPNDLEFQLTLNVKLDKPAYLNNQATSKPVKSKASTFSRVFASPKKRREMELRQKEEERSKERPRHVSAMVPHPEHEHRCFGRPYMAEIACFNEWATEEESFASSVKSKRGNAAAAVVRRAPYKIGKLELQLLFVPRPKNSTDEDMPKSMNSCVRELKAAEERLSRNWEGHLSQQGGDCPYWRRRYFKLVGTKLTAYHEATRQPRATINLSNAKRLIDDRRSLTEKETTGKGGKRRRSAFAEEEEGYMFVEEGFRIRFNNGEVIDFYADTAEDKDGWMRVLSEILGRDSSMDEPNGVRSRAKWCEIVLKREEQLRRKAEGRRVSSRTKSSRS